ncbi:hypothetical protein MPH_07615 [Macrophomina phaseolina MS6]|uniref:F-box domain cyclin-like protein n=1 Tax=Macrophomina phaseolina (strain MS6) TaxID=1126212 RepID=K2RYA4_MACPH|nr:hypothetical protein MPH_07615 [Macrophomina phaseolina MS6]
MKTTLTDLPEALLEKIAVHLVPTIYDNRANPCYQKLRRPLVYDFCLVSKKFYNIGKPLLYRVFVNDNDPRSLSQFISSLIREPILSSHLRILVIGEYLGPINMNQQYDYGQDLRDRLVKRVQELDLFSERERALWIKSLESQEYEAQIAFLMAISPSLETVDIAYGNFSFGRAYVSWIVRLISWSIQHDPRNGQLNALPSLRRFIVRESPNSVYTGDYRFWEVTMLPFLRTAELHHLTETREGLPYWLEKISPIETLVIRPRSSHSKLLESSMRLVKELKFAKYIWDPVEDRDSPLDIEGVVNALRLHRSCLQSLSLECHIDPESIPDTPPMPSLRSFAKLRHIRISGAFFNASFKDGQSLNANDFPPSLESLTINCLGKDALHWQNCVSALLEDENLPRLQCVEVVHLPAT